MYIYLYCILIYQFTYLSIYLFIHSYIHISTKPGFGANLRGQHFRWPPMNSRPTGGIQLPGMSGEFREPCLMAPEGSQTKISTKNPMGCPRNTL